MASNAEVTRLFAHHPPRTDKRIEQHERVRRNCVGFLNKDLKLPLGIIGTLRTQIEADLLLVAALLAYTLVSSMSWPMLQAGSATAAIRTRRLAASSATSPATISSPPSPSWATVILLR